MNDIVGMVDGTILVNVHTIDKCAGQSCCIHNPSHHHMATWKHRWNDDEKTMWRICPHGFWHPDPDQLSFARRKHGDETASLLVVHGCDGCCQPPETLPKQISDKVSTFLDDPSTGIRRGRDWTDVEHEPRWAPTQLQINAAGETRPGFVCIHERENGMGPCGATVFRLEDARGRHSCIVNH